MPPGCLAAVVPWQCPPKSIVEHRSVADYAFVQTANNVTRLCIGIYRRRGPPASVPAVAFTRYGAGVLRTTISTLRFFVRPSGSSAPSGFVFGAIGFALPQP